MIATYHVIIEVKEPGYEPSTLTDRHAWADAIHRGYIVIRHTFADLDASAPATTNNSVAPAGPLDPGGPLDPAALLAYKVIGTPATIAPQPVGEDARTVPPADTPAPTPSSLLGRLATVERRLDDIAPAVRQSDIHAPRPSRLTVLEIDQDHLQDTVYDIEASLSAFGQQHAAAIAYITGLETRVRALEVAANGDHR